MHYVKYKKWWDTKHFRQAGDLWVENRFYCPFPEGTNAYYEFWDEQEHYIKNGYTHEGQFITPLHYLYLNFCPIKNKKEKTVTVPDFWAVDADYFEVLCNVMGLVPNPDPFRPVIFEVSKTRQCGASLKSCVPLLYNMCFVPFSQNYLGAYLSDDTEKTCNMFLNYFYHAQRYCEFGKRFIIQSKYDHYMTGYYDLVDGDKVPGGYQSELHVITWKDNPEKGVGGACDLFLVEEAGLHPYLLTSLKYITPACKDGDYTTGNVLVYGAAGKEGQFQGLNKLHHNPDAYGAAAFDNKWEPESHFKRTGYFIPNYSCRKGHIDEDGNPNQESAINALNKSLKLLMVTDYENYLLELSQYPNKPSEMFNIRGKRRFASVQKELKEHIAFLEANQIYGQAVELFEDVETKQIHRTFVDEKDRPPIRMFPLPPGTGIEGCIEIFEEPDPNPPDDLYIGGIDSYNQEETADSPSLGSVFIYKKVNSLANEGTYKIIVAEYTGKPLKKPDFYKICAYLARYYNAVLLLENEDQEASPWFYNNNYEHLLADQPDLIRNYIPNSKTKRQKGVHAVDGLITAADNKIDRYLSENIGNIYNEKNEVIGYRRGLTRIMSLGLLYELLHYVRDPNKNFDRVRAFGWTLLYEEETLTDTAGEQNSDSYMMLVNTNFKKKSKVAVDPELYND